MSSDSFRYQSLARIATFAWMFLFVVAGTLHAQTTTGIIDGVITDQGGGVLVGATVVANSPSLIQRDLTIVSDAKGYYRVPLLPPGAYRIVFTLQGFQTLERSEIVVRAGQTTTESVTLELSATAETVQVVGETNLIDPRSAKLAFTFSEALIEDTPTARNVNDLFATIPGVQSANNMGVFQPGVVEIQSVLGAGERANTYGLDGANVTDPAGQWNMQSYMPYDSIDEIQLVKAAKPAEIPYQGGFFNTITKSGGNELSGQVGVYGSGEALQGTNGSELRAADELTSTNELVKAYEYTASFGGRIVEDELWWYGSGRRITDTQTLLGFPADIDSDITSLSGKLTYQSNQNHRFTGVVTRFDQDVSHFLFGFPAALALDEFATAVRRVFATSGGVTWTGVLTPTVLGQVNVAAAHHGFDQLQQPGVNEPAVVDLATGLRSRNLGDGTRDQDNKNWNVAGSLSWFVPDAAGRHDVKVGFEYVPTESRIVFDDFQDHRLHTLFGNPFAVRFLSTPSPATWDNDTMSFYAQDDWTVSERLTLNLGLRFMHTSAGTPQQPVSGGTFAGTPIADRFPALNATTLPATDLVSWNTIEPRLAGSYSLDAEGDTILRFGASRYYHHLPSFGLFVSNPAFPLNYVTRWFDDGDRVFEIGEEAFLLFSFGGQLNPVAEDLKRPYTNEWLIGVSRQLRGDIQVSSNFIYRRDLDLLATIDAGVPFSSYTSVDVVDPGPDGETGTGDDGTLTVFAQDPATIGQSRNLLTNPDGNDRTYKGLELTASKRFSERWHGAASLVVSKMEVVQPTTANQTANLFDDPNGLINAEGLDQINRGVQFKLQGTYLFPTGLSVTGFYRALSGLPYTRELVVTDLPQGPFNVFAEPRGSSRTDTESIFDLRLEQTLRLSGGLQIGVIGDIFNVFNAATVVDYGRLTGQDYGDPRSIRNPRLGRVGVRIRW